MVYTARPGRVGASDAHATAPYRSVLVAGSRHLDVSDWTLVGPALRTGPGYGPIDPRTATRLATRVIAEWFDQTLRGGRRRSSAGACGARC